MKRGDGIYVTIKRWSETDEDVYELEIQYKDPRKSGSLPLIVAKQVSGKDVLKRVLYAVLEHALEGVEEWQK